MPAAGKTKLHERPNMSSVPLVESNNKKGHPRQPGNGEGQEAPYRRWAYMLNYAVMPRSLSGQIPGGMRGEYIHSRFG